VPEGAGDRQVRLHSGEPVPPRQAAVGLDSQLQ
jgi:hypothetical protein